MTFRECRYWNTELVALTGVVYMKYIIVDAGIPTVRLTFAFFVD